MGVPQVSQGLADRNFGRLDAVILDFSHASGALSLPTWEANSADGPPRP